LSRILKTPTDQKPAIPDPLSQVWLTGTRTNNGQKGNPMKSTQLLENLEFRDAEPFAQPLLVDQHSRILRWMLKPGQQIAEHEVPHSPFYVVILKGQGVFTGIDGREQAYSAGSLLIFEPGEAHTVRALDEELVFVSFMQSVASMRPDRTGGEIGRE
jgi:quercetin dioxygenase-like cupin family protein